MKNKKIIISIFALLVLIVGIKAFLSFKKDNKLTVSFDTDGGKEVSTVKVTKGNTVDLPVAEKEGYEFIGWYTNDGKQIDSNTVITSDTKLVAKWQKSDDCKDIVGATKKNVIFNTNGGNTINSISICTTCAPETITLPTPIKEGYKFVGWYADTMLSTKVEGSKNDVSNASWTKKDCYTYETTLYAKWEKEEECKTIVGQGSNIVNYATNGGSEVSTLTVCKTCADAYTKRNVPLSKKSGYKFVGWYTDSSLTTKVTFNSYGIPTNVKWDKDGCYDSKTTVYAKWKKEDECLKTIGGTSKKVNFNTNGGTPVNSITMCATCADKTNLPTAKKTGYKFVGWYADSNLTIKIEQNTSNISKATWTKKDCYTYETTLYAKWEKDECLKTIGGTSKKVNFNTNGGNSINSISICVTCAQETIKLPTPTKKGYIFDGWYSDSTLTTKVEGSKNDVSNAIWTKKDCYTYETTIYAKWKKKTHFQ